MRRPEILAPAGDRPALAAALAAGADAVYFGLDDGFNARARAANFPSDGLAPIVELVHRANARAYVTLNTLVFEPELPIVEELIRRVAAAGVDAIIVQDPAVALLARAICPELEVHASTQMTASSPAAAELLRALGLSRVVVPRELSVDEIRAYAAGTSLPLEVFVHGALCVAWSGQCLSSEAWGGRSANRGQCAQACRLPYDLVVDDRVRDLGDVAYLLSPKDLSGADAVPALAEIGVASLKIEGRLKGPAYVATTVARYRAASIEASGSAHDDERWTSPLEIVADDVALELAYSRGRSVGFLAGADHQTLVEGRFPRHRGLALGRVVRVEIGAVVVERDAAQRPITGGRAIETTTSDARTLSSDAQTAPAAARTASSDARTAESFVPKPGMGVVFDRSRPEDPEEGGPIFDVDVLANGRLRLGFGTPGPTLENVRPGDFVWVNSDPAITRVGDQAARAGLEAATLGRIPIDLTVRGAVGATLEVLARRVGRHASTEARVRGSSPLQAARGAGLTRELIADKLGAFGGTSFHLRELDATGLATGLHLPVSELKELRRQLVAQLDAAVARIERVVEQGSVIERLRDAHRVADAPASEPSFGAQAPSPIVVPLCRTDAQLDAVIAAGAREVELDWMELVGLAKAVARAKAAGLRVGVATMRVQKPGEDKIDAHLAKLAPDAVLVRSWGSLAWFAQDGWLPEQRGRDTVMELGSARGPVLHGDFSLNVTSSITAGWVLGRGLATVTAAHDLDRDQLLAMLAHAPRGRVAVTVHHHIPTFHTEHCVYAHLLSTGKDFRTCGRPCEQHAVSLKDRVGLVHPVVVDVGCRNTVFNAQAQSAASLVPELLALGVQRFRVELVRETAAETAQVYEGYRDLIAGKATAEQIVRRASVHEQFGVTRGTMRTLTVLR
jgi:putative protease